MYVVLGCTAAGAVRALHPVPLPALKVGCVGYLQGLVNKRVYLDIILSIWISSTLRTHIPRHSTGVGRESISMLLHAVPLLCHPKRDSSSVGVGVHTLPKGADIMPSWRCIDASCVAAHRVLYVTQRVPLGHCGDSTMWVHIV